MTSPGIADEGLARVCLHLNGQGETGPGDVIAVGVEVDGDGVGHAVAAAAGSAGHVGHDAAELARVADDRRRAGDDEPVPLAAGGERYVGGGHRHLDFVACVLSLGKG